MSDRLDAAVDELVAALREEVAAASRPPADAPTELLSIREAARRLSLGRTAVYDLFARGQLRSIKVGARRLVPADALRDLANGEGAPERGHHADPPRSEKAAPEGEPGAARDEEVRHDRPAAT